MLIMDIRKFFPSIDHQVLKGEIRRALFDRPRLRLIDALIDGSNPQEPVPHTWYPGDDLFAPAERKVGLPIGNLTSQFLANVLLDRIDHLMKDRLRARKYLRYVDDLVVFGDDKVELAEVRAQVEAELAAMRLRLNGGKSWIRRPKEGLTFLGFTVTPEVVRLAQPAVRRHRTRLRVLRRGYSAGRLRLPQIRARLLAFAAHAAHGDTWRLRACASSKPLVPGRTTYPAHRLRRNAVPGRSEDDDNTERAQATSS